MCDVAGEVPGWSVVSCQLSTWTCGPTVTRRSGFPRACVPAAAQDAQNARTREEIDPPLGSRAQFTTDN
jgi:hypothetical protein